MTFNDWWLSANDGANTTDKDSKYPMVKELAKAAFLAGEQAQRTKHGLGVARGRKEAAEDICFLINCTPEPRLMCASFLVGKIKEIYQLEI